jgi:hypothetical protein
MRTPPTTLLLPARRLTLATALTALCALTGGLLTVAVPARAEGVASEAQCKEKFPGQPARVGPSAGLPDCRAYERVTPENLGRSQDMTFYVEDHTLASADGEHLALDTTGSELEPEPGVSPTSTGTKAVFSRTAAGWVMRSIVPPGFHADHLYPELFSLDLSQIAFSATSQLNFSESTTGEEQFEVGPVGGPYTQIASVPFTPNTADDFTKIEGANAGAAGAPPLSHVLFSSYDHALPLSAVEHRVAEETLGGSYASGAPNLYEWSEGRLRLVNVEGEGSRVKLINKCGATLGAFSDLKSEATTVGAVSADGSRVFFTSPEREFENNECSGIPPRLYMRVDGRETVPVSPGNAPAYFNGVTPDGSELFYTEGHDAGTLYAYDIKTGVRTPVFGLKHPFPGQERFLVISEDGSTLYLWRESGKGPIFRAEREAGGDGWSTSTIAVATESTSLSELMYTTPNGQFLVFVADGVEGEPRGGPSGLHGELFRYDHATGSVMCVSCGNGVAPYGEVIPSSVFPVDSIRLDDEPLSQDGGIQMSENGQEVFFETTARLVPQDQNSTATNAVLAEYPGMDAYEWEADGTDGCESSRGCTHLLSTGEAVGPEFFLGASRSGRDVFMTSAAQLAPGATPEFTNIYDMREGGGFPPPAPASECVACHGVGSPPPLFGPGASGTFNGPGNPAPPAPPPPSPPAKRTAVKCAKGRKLDHGKCVKVKSRHKARKTSVDRGGRS